MERAATRRVATRRVATRRVATLRAATARNQSRRPFWAVVYGAIALLLLTACGDDPEPAIDHGAWTNPVTGVVVDLPEAWRHSPDTAAKGETVVGYFTRRYAWSTGRYGHVTLHREDVPSPPLSLQDYAARLASWLQAHGDTITEPDVTRGDGLEQARFEVEVVHERRRERMRLRVWTRGDGHFWYTVTEAPLEEADFLDAAAPIVDGLVASTAPVTPPQRR